MTEEYLYIKYKHRFVQHPLIFSIYFFVFFFKKFSLKSTWNQDVGELLHFILYLYISRLHYLSEFYTRSRYIICIQHIILCTIWNEKCCSDPQPFFGIYILFFIFFISLFWCIYIEWEVFCRLYKMYMGYKWNENNEKEQQQHFKKKKSTIVYLLGSPWNFHSPYGCNCMGSSEYETLVLCPQYRCLYLLLISNVVDLNGDGDVDDKYVNDVDVVAVNVAEYVRVHPIHRTLLRPLVLAPPRHSNPIVLKSLNINFYSTIFSFPSFCFPSSCRSVFFNSFYIYLFIYSHT